MSGTGLQRAGRLLVELPPIALALYAAALLGRTAAGRLSYPYDLEWMEGGMLLHALRVMEGLPIYVRPSPEFIPYLYPPLYSWVMAGLAMLPGVDLSLGLGRLVSLVGTVAACGALVAAARGERVPWGLAVGGAGLYLACYDESGAFYDVVRTDGLLMGLLAWSLVAVRHGWLRSGGLLLALAYAAKHNAAAFGLPAVLWLFFTSGRAAAGRFALWSVGPALAYTLAMQLGSGGLFLTWMLSVPGSHGMVLKRLFPGTPKELFLALPITTGVALAVGVAWIRRWSPGGVYWVAQGLMAVALCAVMRGHTGGFINVLMPGHWTIALWAVLALGAVVARWPHLVVRGLAGLLVAFQVYKGAWVPERYQPTPEDVRAGAELVERLSKIEGEVLAPYSPWLPVLAGKKPYWHLIALWDIDYRRGPFHDAVSEIDRAIADRHWAAVLVGDDDDFQHGLKRHYKRLERIRYKGRAFFPKSGWRRRPEYLYVPLPEGEQAEPEPEKRRPTSRQRDAEPEEEGGRDGGDI